MISLASRKMRMMVVRIDRQFSGAGHEVPKQSMNRTQWYFGIKLRKQCFLSLFWDILSSLKLIWHLHKKFAHLTKDGSFSQKLIIYPKCAHLTENCSFNQKLLK